jgi:putative aldouronate transport system substrate-binding protein
VITTACEHPEVAFRFSDFLLTEEASVSFRLGFEGSEWEAALPGENGRNGEQAKYKLLKPQEWIQPTTNVIWNNEGVTFANIMNFVYEAPDSPTGLAAINMIDAKFQDYVTDEYLPSLLYDAETSVEQTELQNLIVDYVNESVALFTLGDKPLSGWDSYVEDLQKMGVERYVELAQEAYDAMFK